MLLNDERPLVDQIGAKIYDRLFRLEPLSDTIAYLDYDVSESEGLQDIDQYFCKYEPNEYSEKMHTDSYTVPYAVRKVW